MPQHNSNRLLPVTVFVVLCQAHSSAAIVAYALVEPRVGEQDLQRLHTTVDGGGNKSAIAVVVLQVDVQRRNASHELNQATAIEHCRYRENSVTTMLL